MYRALRPYYVFIWLYITVTPVQGLDNDGQTAAWSLFDIGLHHREAVEDITIKTVRRALL